MNEWEARYKSVVGLVEPKHDEAAEMVVKAANDMARSTNLSLSEALAAIMSAAHELKMKESNENVRSLSFQRRLQ